MKQIRFYVEASLVVLSLILFIVNFYLGNSDAATGWVVAFAGWCAALERHNNALYQ
jgi:hypothetical protein